MITGRDLIIYILNNNLEDKPIFQNGTFMGYWTIEYYAQEMTVGVETVKAWINMGAIKGAIPIGGTYLIPKQELHVKEQLRTALKGEND